MGDWTVKRYTPDMAGEWNRFIAQSRNGTFLFDRAYMDYHADRFSDCSMMAYKGNSLRGVLPANITPDATLHSHQGLTYGGWVTSVSHFDGTDMLDLWEVWLHHCRETGIEAVDYKPMPWIYPAVPAQEDEYALFRHRARQTECNLASVIDFGHRQGFSTMMRRHMRSAAKLTPKPAYDPSVAPGEFWPLLTECLAQRHDVRPVHTASEIERLMHAFPDNISIRGARVYGRLEAGVCLYDTGRVVHCQYIASSPAGRGLHLLPWLFDRIIAGVSPDCRYFDFGTSNENHGLALNSGLHRQKSALGGSGVAYTRWEIKV